MTVIPFRVRKRPVVVEAMRFTDLDSYLDIVAWARASGFLDVDGFEYRTPIMIIPTLKGMMAAEPGDWVIRGVHGEFYSCKKEIFEETYEVL